MRDRAALREPRAPPCAAHPRLPARGSGLGVRGSGLGALGASGTAAVGLHCRSARPPRGPEPARVPPRPQQLPKAALCVLLVPSLKRWLYGREAMEKLLSL